MEGHAICDGHESVTLTFKPRL